MTARRRSNPPPPQSTPPGALAPIEGIRSQRVRPPRDLSLAPDIDRALRELTKQRRALSGTGAAWSAVVPPELAEKTTLETLSRGVLTVTVPDAATRFTLDRFLRSGGERTLIGASSAAIRKVRILIG